MEFTSSCPAIVVFDIDGVLRDVSGSYRRALADTVEEFTQGGYRPTPEDIDMLKREGRWNNDWEASQELTLRYFERQGKHRSELNLDYETLVRFFQSRYRGPDPENPDCWTGYITQEPLLVSQAYFQDLSQAGVAWGFFSGATRGSAAFILKRRIGLKDPILVAMEDAPGKPNPLGLFAAVEALSQGDSISPQIPVLYVGDTVADMQTVVAAQEQQRDRTWLGIGVLPPHVRQRGAAYAEDYRQSLQAAGAMTVLDFVEALTPALIQHLITSRLS